VLNSRARRISSSALGLALTLLAASILLLPAPAPAGYEFVGKWQTTAPPFDIATDSQSRVWVVNPLFRTDYPCLPFSEGAPTLTRA